MAEIYRVNPPIVRRNAESTTRRLRLHAPDAQVCREFGFHQLFQITVQLKTIVDRLILHVVPSVNFIKLFLRWLLNNFNPIFRGLALNKPDDKILKKDVSKVLPP